MKMNIALVIIPFMLFSGAAFAENCDNGFNLIIGANKQSFGCDCNGAANKKKDGDWVILNAKTDGTGKGGVPNKTTPGGPFACKCRAGAGWANYWASCDTKRICDAYLSVTFESAAMTWVPNMANMCWQWICNTGFTENESTHACTKVCAANESVSADGLHCTCFDGKPKRNGVCLPSQCIGSNMAFIGESDNNCILCTPGPTQGIKFIDGYPVCKVCDTHTERWDDIKKDCFSVSILPTQAFRDCFNDTKVDQTNQTAFAECLLGIKQSGSGTPSTNQNDGCTDAIGKSNKDCTSLILNASSAYYGCVSDGAGGYKAGTNCKLSSCNSGWTQVGNGCKQDLTGNLDGCTSVGGTSNMTCTGKILNSTEAYYSCVTDATTGKLKAGTTDCILVSCKTNFKQSGNKCVPDKQLNPELEQ